MSRPLLCSILVAIIWCGLLGHVDRSVAQVPIEPLVTPASADAAAIAHRAFLRQTKMTPALHAMLETATDETLLTVLVKLTARADLHDITMRSRRRRIETIITRLQQTANQSQRALLARLQRHQAEGVVTNVEAFWIFNGLVVTATPAVIDELATFAAVQIIEPEIHLQTPALIETAAPATPNLTLVNAPALWGLGYRGQGIVVANLDTGVNLHHPDLYDQWRGGTNSWFDPYGEHSTPVDAAGQGSGHGTWTMGIMVGGGNSGTMVGMAPDAQWIAAKIFNNQGSATAAAIHAAYQWLLDPDGDPGTDDAPHVVNNSWTFHHVGCSLEFEPDLHALRVAGILPIFAAGNTGPTPATALSPGNNPSAFAVGGIDQNGNIYPQSSRGPAICGEAESIYPEMSAPGVNIYTTDIYGLYTTATGTSMAAPHVAGALALLLSVQPDLLVDEQEAALRNGLVDMGPVGPDNDFGNGRLDVLASYQWLVPPPVNAPPIVDAGIAFTIPLTATAQLAGTVLDDGLPDPPAMVTATWQMATGPGVVLFGQRNGVTTTATFSVSGVYRLHLIADDGALQTTDAVTVTVQPAPNQPPTVDAGGDLTVTQPISTITLVATAADDGLPDGQLTHQWHQRSGPPAVTWQQTDTLTTTVGFSQIGVYLLQLDVSDGLLQSSDQLVVVVRNPPPTAKAGDCNGDMALNAGDLSATILEIFDGDGTLAGEAVGGTFAGGPHCDANQDSLINAGDVSCTILLIFDSPDACLRAGP